MSCSESGLAVSMLFGFVFLKKRYSLLQIVCLLWRTSLTYPLTINRLDVRSLCLLWCHYGHTIKTYAKSDLGTVSLAEAIGRFARIHDRHCNDRRLLVPNRAFGPNARKNVQEVWTMLERRCILYGANIYAKCRRKPVLTF